MGDSIYDYATTEASSSTTGGWNTAENQDPSTVNDGMRAHKQNVAKFLKDLGGTITTTGSANAHAATLNQPIATTVPTGFAFKVKWGYTNTSTTVNLNVNSIGNARVKVNYGGILADPIPGDIQAGAYGDIIFDGTNHVLLNPQQRAPYPTGHLYGLTLSNNGSDATNDIDIAVGTARDGADSANIDLTSAITKRLDASWAVGTGNGGLDTGSIANTTYHVWLIKRSDTGVVDVLFSTSASSPTMPSNYDLKRRIGSIIRSGGAILPFTQDGDEFLLKTTLNDFLVNNYGDSAVTRTLTVPSGIIVTAIATFNLQNGSATVASQEKITALSQTDTASSADNCDLKLGASGAWIEVQSSHRRVRTNTSAQIRTRGNGIGGNHFFSCTTHGWVDTRGRT